MKRHSLAVAAVRMAMAIPAAHAAEPILPHVPRATGEAPTLTAWKKIAAAQAETLAKQLPAGSGPWAIELFDANDTQFTRAFSRMLTSELVKHGVQVAKPGVHAGTIEIQVDAKADVRPAEYKPGTISLLTGGLWLVHGVAHAFSPAGAATALALGTDAFVSYFAESPDAWAAELSLTLTAHRSGKIDAANNTVYLLAGYGKNAYAQYAKVPTLKLVP